MGKLPDKSATRVGTLQFGNITVTVYAKRINENPYAIVVIDPNLLQRVKKDHILWTELMHALNRRIVHPPIREV
jgi:hypothetical protein